VMLMAAVRGLRSPESIGLSFDGGGIRPLQVPPSYVVVTPPYHGPSYSWADGRRIAVRTGGWRVMASAVENTG
jgi:hypothetical protein